MLRRNRLLAVIAFGALLWVLPRPEGVSPQAWRLFAIFASTILGLILQVMDSGGVVLLGMVAALLSRAMSIGNVLGGFSNTSVWLIVSAFLFSHAVAATGLGKRVAYLFIRSFGHKTLRLGYALAASELVIAPAVPANTARAGGILFPIVMSISRVCGSLPDKSPRRLGAFLLLNQFHATIILVGDVPDRDGVQPADRGAGSEDGRGADYVGGVGGGGHRAGAALAGAGAAAAVPAVPAGGGGIARSAGGGAAAVGTDGADVARGDRAGGDCGLLPGAVDHHGVARAWTPRRSRSWAWERCCWRA